MNYSITDYEPHIELAFEVLPALDGTAHLVDPDPDRQFEYFPVALCGRALVSKEGGLVDLAVCEICLELSHERQAEFDARLEVTV